MAEFSYNYRGITPDGEDASIRDKADDRQPEGQPSRWSSRYVQHFTTDEAHNCEAFLFESSPWGIRQ